MIKRSALLALFASVGALVAVSAAAGGGASSIQVPIEFDLSGAACSELPATTTIHGTGTGTFSVTPSGHLHAVVIGTATDGQGGFWRFNYAQNLRSLSDGAVEITDHFNLVGSGPLVKVHTHFVIDFASSGDVLAIKQVHGDPAFCDPL